MVENTINEKRWKKLWKIAPDIFQLLKECKTIKIARHRIMNYLSDTELSFRNDYYDLSIADFILFKHALIVLKNIFAKRYERIAESSPITYMWKASREGDCDVSTDFIEELENLFRGIKGSTRVYPSSLVENVVSPDFDMYTGREAAIKRSDFLDALGESMDENLAKFKSGLDPHLMIKRKENKARVLKAFGGSEQDWLDYKWHFKNIIKDEAGLEKMFSVIEVNKDQQDVLRYAVNNSVPLGITPHYLHLMDRVENPDDLAVRKQVFPPSEYAKVMAKLKGRRSKFLDFMRESDTSPVQHITRRYVKVCIIKPYDSCPQICVYCQRNWEIKRPLEKVAEMASREVDKAINWISKHPQIMDVLITGGDPLIMCDGKLDDLLGKLARVPHVKSIRIATRVPVTVPQRISENVIEILKKYNRHPQRFIYLVTHFQHTYEICEETLKVTEKLRQAGISMYNQQVFTLYNSRRFETVALRIALKQLGIDPYYTFNMKGKKEMDEYAVPIARILQERKEEARLLPGIFRTDEPVFNVPFLGKNHMRAWQDHEVISINPDGSRVYAFHPWEKNIRKVGSYIYTDLPIRSYLKKLEELGEDIDDYKSIWYYY